MGVWIWCCCILFLRCAQFCCYLQVGDGRCSSWWCNIRRVPKPPQFLKSKLFRNKCLKYLITMEKNYFLTNPDVPGKGDSPFYCKITPFWGGEFIQKHRGICLPKSSFAKKESSKSQFQKPSWNVCHFPVINCWSETISKRHSGFPHCLPLFFNDAPMEFKVNH